MAFERSTAKLLSGGVNWNPSPESVGPAEASNLLNVAHDSDISLRSRQGSTLLFSAPGNVQFMAAALGGHWQIAGGSICKEGGAIGSAGASTSFASMNQYIWIPGSSKKTKGTDLKDWQLKAPTSPPVAKPSSEPGTVVTDWQDTVVDPAGGSSHTTADAPNGIGWQATLAGGASYSLLSAGGAADLKDFHRYDLIRIWIFFTHALNVSEVTIQLDCGSGDFHTDYFTATLPRHLYRSQAKEWRQFQIRFTQLSATDPTPYFTRVGNTPGKDWGTIAAARVLFSVTGTTKVRLARLDAIGGKVSANKKGRGAGLIEGDDVQWCYTELNDDGHESNPSPFSTMIQVKRQAVDITGLNATNPDTTKINVYRTGGTLGAIYKVNDTPLPIGDYHDDNGDDILTALDVILETDNDLPPTGANIAVGPYFGRILLFKGARMYWSKQNRPFAFTGPDLADGAWADVGDTGDPVQAVTVRPNVCFIYKKNRIHILSGDPGPLGSGSLTDSGAEMGIPGPTSVVKGANGDYFASEDGVFHFPSGFATKVSQKIDSIFKGRTVTLWSGQTIPPIGDKTSMALGLSGDRLYFSYDSVGLILNLSTGNWYQDSRRFTCFDLEGTQMLGARPDGSILQLETGASDNGQAYPFRYERTFDMGIGDTDKSFEDFTIQPGDLAGQTLSVTAFLNHGNQSVGLGVVSGNDRQILQFNGGFGVRGRNITIVLSGLLNAPIEIDSMVLNWYLAAREAKSFDTDCQDYGTQDLKRIREMRIHVESQAPATLTMLSDFPGHGMSTRQTKAIAAGGRRIEHLVFNDDYVGYLFRSVISGGDFRIWQIEALVQKLGLFLEGAVGEFYRSDAIDLSSESVKLLKEAEIIYASDAPALVTFTCELPSGFLNQTKSFMISPTGVNVFDMNEEATAKLKFPNNFKGRLFLVRIVPAGNFRLEAVRANVKSIGSEGATNWSFEGFPVTPTAPAQWVSANLPVDSPG